MPFRILHTSDWHLGRALHAVSLLEDQEVFLAWLLDLLEREPHDALVIAGDVFDRAIPSEDAVASFSRFLVSLRARCPALPVVVIAGNHDSATRLAFGSELLASMQLHLRGGVADIARPIRITGSDGTRAEIWALPFLYAGALHTQRGDERFVLTTQADALEEALARITAHDEDAAQVLVSHCLARGGVVSDSERTIVGTASEIDAGCFARFDYVALGHLHRTQAVAPQAHYSGSPLKYSFSEAGDVKTVLSVAVTRSAAPVLTPHATPVPRDMAILRGTFEALMRDEAFVAHEPSYVRVELTERATATDPLSRLRARFPRLLELRTLDVGGARDEGRDAARARRERGDVELDFVDFETQLRGAAPDTPLLDAFRAVRAAVAEET